MHFLHPVKILVYVRLTENLINMSVEEVWTRTSVAGVQL